MTVRLREISSEGGNHKRKFGGKSQKKNYFGVAKLLILQKLRYIYGRINNYTKSQFGCELVSPWVAFGGV